ncbi:MAG: methyltransferase domain-containing protein [Planctomycetaceae bacterium]|nr:methyltransferase domain-containing protein [Planctomycetaceae bacterium]
MPDVPGGWRRVDIDAGWTSIDFMVPQTPDALLDLPDVIEANRLDDAMPYWATLWPAATTMSRLLAHVEWRSGTRVLEIGCGLGLVGIAGLLRGWNVLMTDGEVTTIDAARHNAALNGFPSADVRVLDWRKPPSLQFPVILACDVLYEVRFHEPILNLLSEMLTDDGVCWLADPGRTPLVEFVHSAGEAGFDLKIMDAEQRACSFPFRGQFQLLELRR